MPKNKTSKTAAKRLKVSKNGKVLRRGSGKSHLLSGKSPKRRRGLRKPIVVTGAQGKAARRALNKG